MPLSCEFVRFLKDALFVTPHLADSGRIVRRRSDMASIFKKPKSPFYFAAFRGANGERVQRTTKQRNRSAALRTAQERESLATKGRNRTLTEAQARRVVSEIVEVSTGESLHFHSCADWFTEWLSGKRGAVSANSLAKYEQVSADFLRHLGERSKLSLAAICPKDVR